MDNEQRPRTMHTVPVTHTVVAAVATDNDYGDVIVICDSGAVFTRRWVVLNPPDPQCGFVWIEQAPVPRTFAALVQSNEFTHSHSRESGEAAVGKDTTRENTSA